MTKGIRPYALCQKQAKRGVTSVLNRIVKTVRGVAQQHDLLFKRGFLQDDAEMRALAEALIEHEFEVPAEPPTPKIGASRAAAVAAALQASGRELHLAGQMWFLGLSPRDRFSVKTATARCLPPVVRPRNSVGFAPYYPRDDPQSLVAA